MKAKGKDSFYAKYIKRILDIICSLLGLIILSPVLLIVAILVRVKLGSPVIFNQTRAGKDEVPFEMIKFRTMADLRDEQGQLLPDTDRFTKFGNFLRNTSLDELPELINVLRGDMSLVGPRPLYTFYLPYYTEEESLRHTVRGGITGLAQVNGRALCKWNDRFTLDVQYLESISFYNDVKILLQTVQKVIKKSDIGVPSVKDEDELHLVRKIQRPNHVKEIGSFFSIEKKDYKKGSKKYPTFINVGKYEVEIFYSTCRSCIREILKQFNSDKRNKKIMVPPFTCESVVNPFIEKGFEVYTYTIEENLITNIKKLKEELQQIQPLILLFHSYFGFNTNEGLRACLEEVVNWEMYVIDDRTQNIFSDGANDWVDYCIGSIRKWGPFPDGAFVLGNDRGLKQVKVEDSHYAKRELEAMEKKQRYLDTGAAIKAEFLNEFAKDMKYIDSQTKTYSMSRISRGICEKYDFTDMIRKRRQNYLMLLNGLNKYDWFAVPFMKLTEKDVPFYFPILVKKKRKEFQEFLANNGVYATIIWKCPDIIKSGICNAALTIYDEILCIPCDQRYDISDMKRITKLIGFYHENDMQ